MFQTLSYVSEDEKQIRTQVFIEEQHFQEEFDDIDTNSMHIVFYVNQEAVGCCRYYYHATRKCPVIGRIAVKKAYRGKQYGKQLLEECERQLQGKYEKCALFAQVRAQAFYEKCGYVATNEIGDDEGCPHVWMEKQL